MAATARPTRVIDRERCAEHVPAFAGEELTPTVQLHPKDIERAQRTYKRSAACCNRLLASGERLWLPPPREDEQRNERVRRESLNLGCAFQDQIRDLKAPAVAGTQPDDLRGNP